MLLLSNKFQTIKIILGGGSSVIPTSSGPKVKIAIDLKPDITIIKDLRPIPRG
jgi:hypothetical protein